MRILAQDEEKVAFWRRHTVVGVVLCVVMPGIAALHTWLTPGAPNAAARYVICGSLALASPLLLLVPVDRVPLGAQSRHGLIQAGLVGLESHQQGVAGRGRAGERFFGNAGRRR